MDQDTAEEDDEENEEEVLSLPTLDADACVMFTPYVRRSVQRQPEFGEFGLVLQRLPVNATELMFSYHVCVSEAGYALYVPPQKWMTVGEDIAFTAFKLDNLRAQGNAFTYKVAIKIKQIR